jgi:hypothetical protein
LEQEKRVATKHTKEKHEKKRETMKKEKKRDNEEGHSSSSIKHGEGGNIGTTNNTQTDDKNHEFSNIVNLGHTLGEGEGKMKITQEKTSNRSWRACNIFLSIKK